MTDGPVGEELVEIVDDSGAVQRVVTRSAMRRHNLRHRNVAVLVQRGDGRLVVHLRADWKDVYPSHWDVAFGGVPNVGETDVDAAIRELAEEAGLELTPDDLVDLGSRAQENDEVRWHARFFAVRTDAELHPADGEVQRMEAIDVGELEGWAASVPVCPDVEPLLEDIPRLLPQSINGVDDVAV